MEKGQELLSLFDTEPVSEEILAASEDIENTMEAMLDAYVSDKDYEGNLRNILEEDEYLTEELLDRIAFLNIVEEAPEGIFTKEELERVYLSVIDSFFELSKLLTPLNGFGKDRLLAGLSLIRQFEEQYWAISTQIVPENVSAFSELIPVEHYDDILIGRKRGLGALRHVGTEVYAVGAIIYSVDYEAEEKPLIEVCWIQVHDDFRQQGVGNLLMAQVIELALSSNAEELNAFIAAELPARMAEDADELSDVNICENFFDSWTFRFSLSYGSRFVIAYSDMNGANASNSTAGSGNGGVRSFKQLGRDGERLLKSFFQKRNKNEDATIAACPYEFFDADTSCALLSEGEMRSVLLFHRFKNGDYRYEGYLWSDEKYIRDIVELLDFFYEAAMPSGEDDPMISGFFDSLEGYHASGRMFANARIPMVYSGSLALPNEAVSSEEWGELREEAGFSNDKLPEEGFSEDIGKEDEERMMVFLEENGFKDRL